MWLPDPLQPCVQASKLHHLRLNESESELCLIGNGLNISANKDLLFKNFSNEQEF